jgi:hypothetical protein
MREAWRILAPEGRLVIITPRRSSLWAVRDLTPFGWGRPFSRGQLQRLLEDTQFTPTAWGHALHWPPVRQSWLLQAVSVVEAFGAAVLPAFSGAILVEAVKRLHAKPPRGSAHAPAFVRALAGGWAQPQGAPAGARLDEPSLPEARQDKEDEVK